VEWAFSREATDSGSAFTFVIGVKYFSVRVASAENVTRIDSPDLLPVSQCG
jgi:hypothetical protein